MNESNIFGVSVRALIVFMLTLTVCGLTTYMVIAFGVKDKIPEPLYSGFMMGLGFYLGQKSIEIAKNDKQEGNGGNNDKVS